MSFDFKLQPNFILLEEFDETIIDSAIQKYVDKKAGDLEMHIIYAGHYYIGTWQHETLVSLVTKALEKHDSQSAIITQIYMLRHVLITKEKMEEICLGKGDWNGNTLKESVNDDLESVF